MDVFDLIGVTSYQLAQYFIVNIMSSEINPKPCTSLVCYVPMLSNYRKTN